MGKRVNSKSAPVTLEGVIMMPLIKIRKLKPREVEFPATFPTWGLAMLSLHLLLQPDLQMVVMRLGERRSYPESFGFTVVARGDMKPGG